MCFNLFGRKDEPAEKQVESSTTSTEVSDNVYKIEPILYTLTYNGDENLILL